MENKTPKIGLKDKKILCLLDFNARVPLSTLSKQLGLSKQSIEYRINSMVKQGIIDGFYPVINTPLLGYIYCRIFVQVGSLEVEEEKKLKKYVFENKNLFWAFTLGGSFDYLLVFWVKKISEFEKIVKEFEALFGKFIVKKQEQVITNVIHLSHKFSDIDFSRTRFDLKETEKRVQIDEVDKKILKQLAIEARTSLVDIARKTGLSTKVIAYRIKKMEGKKLLAGYRPIINYDKIGLTLYKVFFNLKFESLDEIDSFEKFLLNHPKVIYIVHGISIQGDVDLELLAASTLEFFDFIKEVKNAFPKLISDYTYLIYTSTFKVNYLPFY